MLDETISDLGGYKDATLSIRSKGDSADGVWSRLKFEGGVHRVQRVPVTESQGRVHTSAAGVLVYPEPEEVEESPDRRVRPAHRRLPVVGPGRPGRQHHRLGGAHHPPAHRHRRHLPERAHRSCRTRPARMRCWPRGCRRWPRSRRRPTPPPTGPARSAPSTAASASAPTTSRRTGSPTTGSTSRRTTSTRCSTATSTPVRRAGGRRQAVQAAAGMTRLGGCDIRRSASIDAAAVALAEAGVGSPRADAELLAAHAAGTDRGRLAFADTGPRILRTLRRARRAARRSGYRCNTLAGTARVRSGDRRTSVLASFIPRPETEALLEWASPSRCRRRPVIVDLCTGTGALALALSKHWPDARVIAVDDSEDALAYARRNAAGTACRTDAGRRHRAGSARAELDGQVGPSSSPTRRTFPTARPGTRSGRTRSAARAVRRPGRDGGRSIAIVELAASLAAARRSLRGRARRHHVGRRPSKRSPATGRFVDVTRPTRPDRRGPGSSPRSEP